MGQGEALTRGVRPFVVAYKSETVTVELPGYYPTGRATACMSART